MQKKSIYATYTGSTIGMQRSDNDYVSVFPGTGSVNWRGCRTLPCMTVHEYALLIDSSDMTPDNWQAITSNIPNMTAMMALFILHGTGNTMAFTASALSFMMENLDKPVIVTGSQTPLEELRSDGQTNPS